MSSVLLLIKSARGSEDHQVYESLDHIAVNRLKLDEKEMHEYRRLDTDKQRIEFLEDGLNDTQAAFSPSDESIATFTIKPLTWVKKPKDDRLGERLERSDGLCTMLPITVEGRTERDGATISVTEFRQKYPELRLTFCRSTNWGKGGKLNHAEALTGKIVRVTIEVLDT